MTTARIDHDLLQPTLTEQDDLQNFDRPWNPSHLVYFSFFCGPLPGGLLLVLNDRRLGLRPRYLTILGSMLAIVVAWILLWRLYPQDMRTEQDLRRFAGIGSRAATVLLAYLFTRAQTRRFELYENGDGEPGRLWPYALAALALGLVLTYLIAFGGATSR